MRKALLSNLPLPSQFYNIGNNEAHMPYLDAFMQMETKGNVHGDAFCLESNIFNNDNQLRDGAFTIPYQSNFNSNLQDYQCGSFYNGNYFQQSMSLGSCKLEIPQFQSDNQKLQNGRRKRSIVEVQNQQAPLNETTAALNDDPWEKNKRKKYLSTFFERQQYHYSADHQITESAVTEIKDFKFLHLPVRRSQKLSDKITALQKLVSPYGKTDTASVLQEASLYIKLLQEQIQNFFQMLSSSYNSLRATHSQEIGKKHQDLRSRGLCLVPTSFTQE